MQEPYMTFHDKLPEWATPSITRGVPKSAMRLKIEVMNIGDTILVSLPKAKRIAVVTRAHQIAKELGFKCSTRSYTSSDGANVCIAIARVR